ncbi:MAG: hypothetical protein JST93_33445 [Acidobacteria bacterium]|nr:hypothetical protein [Acidobacteriota bacterium]
MFPWAPPQKGMLLEPGHKADIEAQPGKHREVAQEICRGVRMVPDLAVEESSHPGWIRTMCQAADVFRSEQAPLLRPCRAVEPASAADLIPARGLFAFAISSH